MVHVAIMSPTAHALQAQLSCFKWGENETQRTTLCIPHIWHRIGLNQGLEFIRTA